MVKLGGKKKRKLNENRGKFTTFDETGKKFMNFVEIWEAKLQYASLT